MSICSGTLVLVIYTLCPPPQPPEAEKGDAEKGIIEEEEDEIPKTPEPKEWVCLGSDLEIMEGHFQDTRPLVGGIQQSSGLV